MKHTQLLPYLALASAFAAACVVDVNGLATTPGAADGSVVAVLPDGSVPPAVPDGAATPADSGAPVVAPANTYSCGWERTFFKKVTTSLPKIGNALMRYDALGRGSVVTWDTEDLKFDRVIGVGSKYVVATAQRYVGAGVLPQIALVSLETGVVTTSSFGGAPSSSDVFHELHEASGDFLFVVALPTVSGAVKLQRVDMGAGTATDLHFDASFPAEYATPRLHVGHRYISLTGSNGITSRPLDISDSAPSNRIVQSNPAEAPFFVSSDTGARAIATLNVSKVSHPTQDLLGLWFVDPFDPALQRQASAVLGGANSTPQSLDYQAATNSIVIASDLDIWRVQAPFEFPLPSGAATTVIKRLYSYTPQFGGLQPIGISDLRVDITSSSGLATYVQPCGEYNGNPELGVRTLPNSADPGQWLWQTEGFPMLSQNRALVNAGGYGYRIAYVEPVTP